MKAELSALSGSYVTGNAAGPPPGRLRVCAKTYSHTLKRKSALILQMKGWMKIFQAGTVFRIIRGHVLGDGVIFQAGCLGMVVSPQNAVTQTALRLFGDGVIFQAGTVFRIRC
jgi:hypothetical protein